MNSLLTASNLAKWLTNKLTDASGESKAQGNPSATTVPAPRPGVVEIAKGALTRPFAVGGASRVETAVTPLR